MEGKKSFVLYSDNIHMVSSMPDEDAGKLFKMIFEYVNDKNPDEKRDGPLVATVFAHVKQRFKEDLVKWKETKEKRSKSGKKGAEAKHGKTWQVPEVANENKKEVANLAVKVNVYTSYIERLCSAFNISEQRNGRSFFAATYFVEALAKDGRLDYFSSQLEGYISLREQRYRGSIDKFMGTPEDNYNNGVWCKETYSVAEKGDLTPEQRRIKSAYGFVPTIAK